MSLKQLESLNADYDVLLAQMEKDPNFAERIAPATLGTEPKDNQTIYPQINPEDLALARQALMEDANQPLVEAMAPQWLMRCCEPSRRIVLLLAGACLVLISFAFFGAERTVTKEEQ